MDVSSSVSSPGFDVFLLSHKSTLWQASTEDQLRNFGMPSFVTVKNGLIDIGDLSTIATSPSMKTTE